MKCKEWTQEEGEEKELVQVLWGLAETAGIAAQAPLSFAATRRPKIKRGILHILQSLRYMLALQIIITYNNRIVKLQVEG